MVEKKSSRPKVAIAVVSVSGLQRQTGELRRELTLAKLAVVRLQDELETVTTHALRLEAELAALRKENGELQLDLARKADDIERFYKDAAEKKAE